MKTKGQNTNEVSHTPTPWKISRNEFDERHSSDLGIYAETPIHKNPKWIGRVYGQGNLSEDTGERNANAAFICRAVNAHEELLAALKTAKAYMVPGDKTIYGVDIRTVEKAIAKAEGRS